MELRFERGVTADARASVTTWPFSTSRAWARRSSVSSRSWERSERSPRAKPRRVTAVRRSCDEAPESEARLCEPRDGRFRGLDVGVQLLQARLVGGDLRVGVGRRPLDDLGREQVGRLGDRPARPRPAYGDLEQLVRLPRAHDRARDLACGDAGAQAAGIDADLLGDLPDDLLAARDLAHGGGVRLHARDLGASRGRERLAEIDGRLGPVDVARGRRGEDPADQPADDEPEDEQPPTPGQPAAVAAEVDLLFRVQLRELTAPGRAGFGVRAHRGPRL